MGMYGFDGTDHSSQDHTVSITRRIALGLSLGGIMSGLGVMQADAGKKSAKRCKKKLKRCKKKSKPGICADKNWCVDRTQTCGPEDGYGKCLIEATGGNICAEVLFQVPSCSACAPPACANCRCVLAAGGGDRCNNGASGYDFICVREV